MTTPQAVVFDLGKVLVDFDYAISARKIAARGRSPVSQVQKVIEFSPLLVRYETGLVSSEEFYAQVSAATGFAGDPAEFSRLFGDIFFPITPMVQLHARLHEQQIPTFIFSNTNEMAIQHIRRHFPFFGNFAAHILSYEHGAMKPDPKLYAVVERMTNSAAEQILYLDDRLENVEAGLARGWQVIHHQRPEDSIAAVQRLGLLSK